MEDMKMRKIIQKVKEKKGFTLIEMIIVIAIIAILIALIAPNMMKFLDTAKKTKAEAAAKTLYTSAQAYATELYVADKILGDSDASVTYANGNDNTKDFEKDYFNSEELKSIKSYSFKVKKGVVTYAEVEMQDGEKGNYPSKDPTTP